MQSSALTILVVDDDPGVRSVVQRQLEEDGYAVVLAADGATARDLLERGGISLVVLDRGLPDVDGLELCREIRARERTTPGLPVIMLTAVVDEPERLAGFEAGVDDYVSKPFSADELTARIAAVLRRVRPFGAPAAGLITIDERLQLDLGEHEVIVEGRRLRLRPTETRLLALLVQHAGKTLPFATILSEVWGPEYGEETHYVHLYITYLRQKIEPDPRNPRYLHSRRGVGYCFQIAR
jgi:two-component system KDP operon response regulator KdpE